jgi:putative endonuclease
LSREKGNLNENRAVKFLEFNGFSVVKRNFYTRSGEIDIIAKKDEVLHFVEVKSGKTFNPSQNLTERKLEKILKSVHIFLSENDFSDFDISIDLLSIYGDQFNFIENISL